MKIILLLFSTILVNSYKILVISPAYGVSHLNFMGKIADTLTEAGHNVTYYVNDLNPTVGDRIGVKSTTNVIRIREDLGAMSVEDAKVLSSEMWTVGYGIFDVLQVLSKMKEITGGMSAFYNSFFNDMDLIARLKAEKFDIALGEAIAVYPLALMEHLEIPARIVVQTEVFRDATAWSIGEKIDYTTVPAIYGVCSDRMSMYDRVENAIRAYLHSREHTQTYEKEMVEYRRILGDHMPHWEELFQKSSYALYNSNNLLDFPRQTLPKTLQIGGLTVDAAKWKMEKLDKEFLDLLNLRKTTVLVSFGSLARSSDMPEAFKKNIHEVMKSLPDITFLWKYEEEVDWEVASNVHLIKWVPQVALLANSNLSLFVTHGGLSSIHEVAFLGVPTITVPLTFDQPRNARMLERHGGSIFYDKKNLGNFGELRGALLKALGDESYKINARKLAELLNSSPMSAKEILVKHVEFAAKVGALKSLDVEERSLFVTLYLDVISTISVILFALIYSVYRLIKRAQKLKSE